MVGGGGVFGRAFLVVLVVQRKFGAGGCGGGGGSGVDVVLLKPYCVAGGLTWCSREAVRLREE